MSREAERRRASAPRQPPPETFTRGIRGADRVVITDFGALYTYTGNELVGLIEALCLGQRDNRSLKGSFPLVLDFYADNRLLCTTRSSGTRFDVDGIKYATDPSVWKSLAESRGNPDPHGAWLDAFVADLMQKPGFGGIQHWAVDMLERYNKGTLKTESGLTRYSEIPQANLPDWLRAALPYWQVCVVTDSSARAGCLLVTGWGCEGSLLVGPPDFTTSRETFRFKWRKGDRPVTQLRKYKPGIYAMHFG